MKYNKSDYEDEDEDDGSCQINKESENSDKILVYVRIRPFLSDELLKDDTTFIKEIDLNSNILKSKKNKK